MRTPGDGPYEDNCRKLGLASHGRGGSEPLLGDEYQGLEAVRYYNTSHSSLTPAGFNLSQAF